MLPGCAGGSQMNGADPLEPPTLAVLTATEDGEALVVVPANAPPEAPLSPVLSPFSPAPHAAARERVAATLNFFPAVDAIAPLSVLSDVVEDSMWSHRRRRELQFEKRALPEIGCGVCS